MIDGSRAIYIDGVMGGRGDFRIKHAHPLSGFQPAQQILAVTGEKALTQRYDVARVAAMREVVKVSHLRHQEVLIIKPGKAPGSW
ncbi:hypothetical protein GOX01_09360 [Gluconobacter oxydans]|nr:hypothetical protein GOX01_09360 [Gluconobacter oxydans]